MGDNFRYVTTIEKKNYILNIYVDETPVDEKTYLEGARSIIKELLKI